MLVAGVTLVSGCGSTAKDENPPAVQVPTPTGPPGDAPPGMVWIPGGRFMMGSSLPTSGPAERPVHPVYVHGFFMDVNTVTNAQFAEFVAATKYVTIAERIPSAEEILKQAPPGTPPPDPKLMVPGSLVFAETKHEVDLQDWSQWWRWVPGANWRHPTGPASSIKGKDKHPVVQIAWPDAIAYAEWAGRRLPTEAEWEFAARAGQPNSDHTWGDAPYDPSKPQANIYEGKFPLHAAAPKQVASFAANAYGLHDMSGNVWQWTMDWYRPDAYSLQMSKGVAINPTGPASGLDPRDGYLATRVIRGGSYLCSDSYCRGYRVSARSPADPQSGTSHIGFRTVMTAAQWKQSHAAK